MPGREVGFVSGGARLRGYLVTPDGGAPHPGLVVIHELHGLNDNIRDITARLAAEGYAALAVDLFSDRSRVICMARLMGALITGREPFGVADLTAAADYLVSQPEVDADRVGAIGFCMGGGFAIAWARRDQRLRAIAPFYGTNPRPLEAVRRFCPTVGSYPGKDLTARSGRRLDAHLEGLGVPHDIRIYPEARHSFFNDRSRAHDAAAAADAWRRTLAFFAEHVCSPSPSSTPRE